ncbi:restriction endonuclease subunit S [Lactobacillus salivarius]|uniref:Restriction endonuclease subunit S n=3 Tax=Ligilactobacillus salivarius TaxID=1624 RepID=A0ABD6J4T1_9LACO|nr:restriction endonuclease subunit S [Ligilactobacillus salivarius]HBU68050.1 restriction endonuclease subunit S [Lactobacillus sp.]MBM6708123.1 restriction endonuclease subunit S [Ligilactobacillus salivarius]MDE1501046.1 restriction endonuclease subunit S [Ligilactobacillus salivarius]MDE1543518.1 restriction endonuclease subunit S [Ligilactobacillus salivarius]MYU49558.1 restriction endonuclease subunit S [Ligilactobacillus salivarius]
MIDMITTTLGEVGKVKMCKRILKEQTSNEGDIPFYKIGTFGGQPDSFINKELFEKYKEKFSYPKIGNTLISASGTIGRTVRYEGEEAYYQDSNIVWIDNDESKVLDDYLYYVYQNIRWVTTTGATITRLYNSNIESMEIKIPKDLNVQKQIVDVLNPIEKKISLNNSICEKLELIAKTIYDYWFLQFEFPNEEGKPYKSSGGKMVWNKELQQEIPDGWASSKLKNIIVENPKSKIKVSDVKNDGEIPFFTSGTDILSTSESIVSGLNCYLNTGGNADVKYYYGEASYSTDTWCITAENETKYILPFVLNKIKPSMDKVFFQGTGLRHLQKNLLREYQFCLPDSNVVKEFSKLASDIFKKQHYLLEENKKLESLKQFLLPLLMNGQVTINEK